MNPKIAGPGTPRSGDKAMLVALPVHADDDACCEHCSLRPRRTLDELLADHLTPVQLVDVLRGSVNIRTLANWRSERLGPRYIKIGRAVLYPPDAVHEWLLTLCERSDDHWQDIA